MHVDERHLDQVYRRHGDNISYERKPANRRDSLKLLLKRKINESTQIQTNNQLEKLASLQKHKEHVKSVSFKKTVLPVNSRQVVLKPLQGLPNLKTTLKASPQARSLERHKMNASYSEITAGEGSRWDYADQRTFEKNMQIKTEINRRRSSQVFEAADLDVSILEMQPSIAYETSISSIQIPDSVMKRRFSKAEWDEYQRVNGSRIKDLNKQQDYSIQRIKREWERSKDIHLGFLEETPLRMTWADNSQASLIASDFSFPMINMGKAHRKKRSKNKKAMFELIGRRDRPKTKIELDSDKQYGSTPQSGRIADIKINTSQDRQTDGMILQESNFQTLTRDFEEDQKESIYSDDNKQEEDNSLYSDNQAQQANQSLQMLQDSRIQISTMQSNDTIDQTNSKDHEAFDHLNQGQTKSMTISNQNQKKTDDSQKIIEASIEKEQTYHGSNKHSPKNILPKRKQDRQNQSQAVFSNSESPKRSKRKSPSNRLHYPDTLASVPQDGQLQSGSLPKYRKIKRKKAKEIEQRLLHLNTLKPGQKSLAEVVGWRHRSAVAEAFEENSQAGAAWSPQKGLDVEAIYNQMTSTQGNATMLDSYYKRRRDGTTEQVRQSRVESKVQGLIKNAGAGLAAQHEAFLQRNQKLIRRIRHRLDAEGQDREQRGTTPTRQKMANLGQGAARPRLKYPDPTNPHHRKNRSGLVKYAQSLNKARHEQSQLEEQAHDKDDIFEDGAESQDIRDSKQGTPELQAWDRAGVRHT